MAFMTGPIFSNFPIIETVDQLVKSVTGVEDKKPKRQGRFRDLSRSVVEIFESARDKLEMAEDLLPQDDGDLKIWKIVISEESLRTMTEGIKGIKGFIFPEIKIPPGVNITRLFETRFLIKKAEFQLQALLECVREAVVAVSEVKMTLSTLKDLVRDHTISESEAVEAEQKMFAQLRRMDIELDPNFPSNLMVSEELRQRDIANKVYMDEDPTLELTPKWLAEVHKGMA